MDIFIIGSLIGATWAALCVGAQRAVFFYFLLLIFVFILFVFESTPPPIITRFLNRSGTGGGSFFQ